MSTDEHKDGIYFGIDRLDYHADKALGSSAIKDLCMSPLHFWANHIDLDREEQTSDALNGGSAFDDAITFGMEEFDRRYCSKFNKADFPNALDTVDDLQQFVTSKGHDSKSSKQALVKQVMEIDDSAEIMHLLKKHHDQESEGKIQITVADTKGLKTALKVLQQTQAYLWFKSGQPQVAIFWTGKDGVRRKCLVDYLQAQFGIDLKTYVNSRNIPTEKFVGNAMANFRYDLQAFHYMEGIEEGRRFAQNGNVFSLSKVPEYQPGKDWLKLFSKENKPAFWFFFVERGKAPTVTIRSFDQFDVDGVVHDYYQKAAIETIQAVDQFKKYSEAFKDPSDPWVGDIISKGFADEDFPVYHYR